MATPTDCGLPRRSWARVLGASAAALIAAGVLGSGAAAGAATSNTPIGASGSVAALSGSSMEVQNSGSGQTTVNWTSTTQFSKSVTEAVSAITVGDCVTATGSASKKSKTTIAARNITVSMPSSSGTCGATGGARVGPASGGPPSGGSQFRTGSGNSSVDGTPPSALKGAPPGNFRPRLANLDIASGKVTAVNGSTITLSGISISPSSFTQRSTSSSKSKKSTKSKSQTLKVTTSSSTPVDTTQSVTSSALAVGDCVSAFWPAASNGSVTATAIRISSTGGGSCAGGFPGGGQFFGGPGGGGA